MYALIFRLRCCVPGVVLLAVVLALTPLVAVPAQAQPPAPTTPTSTLPPPASATPSPTTTPTPTPPRATPAVGEPLLTPRVLDRLYRHAPNPPDVLGIQLVVVSAVAATVDVTATLSALAIPAIGSSFPARTTLQVTPEQETTFLFPGGFTVPSDTPIGSQACVDMQWLVRGGSAHSARACATVIDVGGELPATATPSGSTPTPPPTAPCYLAALAALTRQGALYSQGGRSWMTPPIRGPASPIRAPGQPASTARGWCGGATRRRASVSARRRRHSSMMAWRSPARSTISTAPRRAAGRWATWCS